MFVGPYLREEEKTGFGVHYRNMTDGFLSLPVMLPGTAVWRGMQSRKAVIRLLTRCSAESKKVMREGKQPSCLLDFWVEHLLSEEAEALKAGQPVPKHFDDAAVADVMMDFLFASQDASTASLTWICALLADYPAVLAQLRAEQARVKPAVDALTTGEQLAEMAFTRQARARVGRVWRAAGGMH